MKEIIIFGVGNWAKIINFYISSSDDFHVVAFTADKNAITELKFCGLPVISFEEIEIYFSPNQYSMIMAIGYKNMNDLREQKYVEAKEKGYIFENYIHPSVVTNNLIMGEGNIVLENVCFEPFSTLGNNNIIASSSMIAHNVSVNDNCFVSAGVDIAGFSVIEKNCFIGLHSSISNKIVIGEHTLVGAGCYVSKSTVPYSVIVPARSVVLEGKKSTDFF